MAKITRTSGIVKKNLAEITLLENTRSEYEEESIIGLAKTIKARGQLQPVVIDAKGNLKAGYRRYYAHKYLVSKGEDFNQIECIVKIGDFLIDNLIENIQRENLSASDLEKALHKMAEEGYSQKEISELIGKPKTWVSDAMAANKTRERAETIGADTEGLSTSAVSLLRSVSDDQLKEVVETVKKNGGTVKSAREAVKKTKPKQDKKEIDQFQKIKAECQKLIKSGS